MILKTKSLGIGLEESWKKLIDGETGIDLITSYDTTNQPVKIAGEDRKTHVEPRFRLIGRCRSRVLSQYLNR